MQIEINEAMQQDSANSSNRSRMKRARKMTLFRHEGSSGTCEQQPEKRDAAQTTQNPCLGQRLDVVIVNVVHHQAVVA